MFTVENVVNFVLTVLATAVGISVFFFLRWLVRGLIVEDFPNINNPGGFGTFKKPLWNKIQQLAITNKTKPDWIITYALALYTYIMEETIKNSHFYIEKSDGPGIQPLDLSLLVHPGKKPSEAENQKNHTF
jgi:hypothetical protein